MTNLCVCCFSMGLAKHEEEFRITRFAWDATRTLGTDALREDRQLGLFLFPRTCSLSLFVVVEQ